MGIPNSPFSKIKNGKLLKSAVEQYWLSLNYNIKKIIRIQFFKISRILEVKLRISEF